MNHGRLLVAVGSTAFLALLLPSYFDGGWVGWLVTIPGTFLHELAHFGFALLLGAQPEEFSIIPSFYDGAMVSYGHITFSPSWWNAATICLAPLLVAPASVWLVVVSARAPLVTKPLFIWGAAAGFYSAAPSSVDWAVAVQFPLSFVPAFFILIFSCHIWWRLIRYELRRGDHA